MQVWAVLGPTASGKTEAALELALRHGGEILSCDSIQVYQGFDIGSAKPSAEALSQVPHHLVNILHPLQPCTAGFWRDAALKAASDISARGRVPIIAGGTGLYFKALFCGLFEGVSTSPPIRARLQQELADQPALYARLQTVDPAYAARISPNDARRIVRALEAFEVTGEPFSALHQNSPKPPWQWVIHLATPSPEVLGKRIAQRTASMLREGLIEETLNLAQSFPSAPALQSIGYGETLAYLRGEVPSLRALQELITLNTRHFAKRQQTLFRSLLKAVPVIALGESQ